MEQFLFGIGLVFGYWAWRAWKRTALDSCRDRLFDIRDDARKYFVERGIPLDDRVYVALRGLLNAHIRYAKRMTFPLFISMTLAMHNEQSVMVNMHNEINSRLKTDDPDLASFIEAARKNSSEAMMKYIGETSAFLIFSVLIGWPVYVSVKTIKAVYSAIQEQNRVMVDGFSSLYSCIKYYLRMIFRAIPLAIVSMVMAIPARAGSIDEGFNSAKMLEEYSYEASLVR